MSEATAKVVVAGLNAAATGGDPQDIVESMVLQGLTNEALDFIANNEDFKKTLNDLGASVGIGDQVSVSGEWSTLPDGTEVLTETLETKGNLGDIIADVADTIANPSGFTPSSTESSNVILNLAGEAVQNPEKYSVVFPSLLDIYNTVIEESTKETTPSKPDAPDIFVDTTQEEPIVIDEEANEVTVNVPKPIEETEVEAGGGGGGGSQTEVTETVVTPPAAPETPTAPETPIVPETPVVPETPEPPPASISLEPWNPETQYEIGDAILDAGGNVWTYIGKDIYSQVGRWTPDKPTDEIIDEYESQTGDDYDPTTTRIIVLGDPTGVGTQDVVEPDLDNDGVPDSQDPEPLNPEVSEEEEIPSGDLLGTVTDIFKDTVDDTTTTPVPEPVKSTTATSGSKQAVVTGVKVDPSIPDETGGFNTGTGVRPSPTTPEAKATTTTETATKTQPDETGGYDTGVGVRPSPTVTQPKDDTTGMLTGTGKVIPDETGGFNTGTGVRPEPTVTGPKETTTIGAPDRALPDETGGYGTGTDGTTDSGTGTGDGTGDGTGTGGGTGTGIGDGVGDGVGDGTGLFGGSGSGYKEPTTPTTYMGSISFNPQLLTPLMFKQSKDYLAELIARLQQ